MKTAPNLPPPANVVQIEQTPLVIPDMQIPHTFKSDDDAIAFFERAANQAREKKLVRLRGEESVLLEDLRAKQREIAETEGTKKAAHRSPSIPDAELLERALKHLKKDIGIPGSEVADKMGMGGNQKIPNLLASESEKKDGKIKREGIAKATRYFLK